MTQQIPKIIHFVWAGGEKIMLPIGVQNVIKWAELNPDFTVKIWVDKLTDPNYIAKYKEKYPELFDEKEKNKNIEFADINQEGICTPEIRYEIDGLAPNYGASSDMLRYQILAKEGGAYFDCMDVFPNEKVSLGNAKFSENDTQDPGRNFFEVLEGHRLVIHVTPHSTTGSKSPGSEAMLCTPGNLQMQDLAKEAFLSYCTKSSWNYKSMLTSSPEKMPVSFNQKAFLPKKTALSRVIAQSNPVKTTLEEESLNADAKLLKASVVRGRETLDNTGPGMVQKVLSKDQSGRNNGNNVPKQNLMIEDEDKTPVTYPPKHAETWAKIRILPMTQEKAIAKAIESLYFEYTEMDLINLSHHAYLVTESIKGKNREHKETYSAGKKNYEVNQPTENITTEDIENKLRERISADPRFDKLRLDPRFRKVVHIPRV